MSVTFYTGQKKLLTPKLIETLRAGLHEGEDHALIVLVPEQLTLETEILTLHELNLKGSFALNVMSPKRLCSRIFDETGHPDPVVIDERGRAILMGNVLRTQASKLKWYASAREKRGFEMRVVEEMIRFKQAGVTPQQLKSLAQEEEDGALKWKLNDLSLLYEAYEKALAGRFQDGEDEINKAIIRMPRAKSLKTARVFVFGFDITTPIYNRFFASLARECQELSVFLSLENDGKARDFSIYQPLQASYERFVRTVIDEKVDWKRVKLVENKIAENAVAYFAREVFCLPNIPYKGRNNCVQLAALNQPIDEARFAAALIRSLVRKKGWRYGDILLLCPDLSGYMDAIQNAFEAYDVPVFAPESRAADRHPLPRFLLESMKMIGSADGNPASLLLTGYADVTDAEADQLLSYIAAHRIKPRALFYPFRKGEPTDLEAVEAIRRKVMEPIIRLKTALSQAETLKAQLKAIFDYMTELRSNEKGEITRSKLIALGQRTLAAEDAQVWNRVMGTLDQMATLMEEKPMGCAQLTDLLKNAFSSTQIKPLPQSQDAVNAMSAARAGSTKVKALIVIGATASTDSGANGLFAAPETQKMSQALNCFLGADALARTRTDRMYIKNALSMAESYLCVTYPLSDAEGKPASGGALVKEIKSVFPSIPVRGGVTDDASMENLRYGAMKAAVGQAAVELSEGALSAGGKAALSVMASEEETQVQLLERALMHRVGSEEMGSLLSRRVYGPMNKVSVTRLEAFAGCPFFHYVKYALRPENDEPVELNSRDEGSFYHEAVRAFLEGDRNAEQGLSPEDAVARMNAISDSLLEGALHDVIEDSHMAKASARKMRRTAARAARTLNEQLSGSRFQPLELEMSFGDEGVNLTLNDETGQTRLGGRIDRIDALEEEGTRYLRVVDYKRSAQKLEAPEVYYGLQLQLILYLAEALRKYGGKSAGVFYFRVSDPVIDTDCLDPEQIERERMERMRMEGILPRDRNLLMMMAAQPDRVFNIRFLKSGELSSRVNAADDREFALLIRHAVEKASQFSKKIRQGVTQIEPVKTKNRDVCSYCDYRGICMRDKKIPGGKAKKLKFMTFQEVYEKIEKSEMEP